MLKDTTSTITYSVSIDYNNNKQQQKNWLLLHGLRQSGENAIFLVQESH